MSLELPDLQQRIYYEPTLMIYRVDLGVIWTPPKYPPTQEYIVLLVCLFRTAPTDSP